MFNEFAESQDFAGYAELFFEGIPRRDRGGWVVGAEEVPGVEAGEVLDCAEGFVSADFLLLLELLFGHVLRTMVE